MIDWQDIMIDNFGENWVNETSYTLREVGEVAQDLAVELNKNKKLKDFLKQTGQEFAFSVFSNNQ